MKRADERTEKSLRFTERQLDSYYARNSKRAINLLEKFYNRHKKEIESKIKELENGEITKKEYRAYMLDKILLTRDFKKTVDRIAEVFTDINQNAVKTIVNTGLERVYIDNYNSTLRDIGEKVEEIEQDKENS